MRLVTGLFPSRAVAERAARELIGAGFGRDGVSLVVSAATRARDFGEPNRDMRDNGDTRAGEAAAVGVATGGVLGAVAAGLVAVVGIVAAPGVGLFAAGPLAAMLAGAGSGSVAGGLLGALVGAGLPESEAKYASGRVLSGGILVGVHAADAALEARARRILLSLGGTAVHSEVN